LNIRRILRYDAPPNPLGLKHVYEIWGWTDESQAWPYVVVAPEIPHGMPIGSKVYEQGTVAGYFFKLQGYYAAGAGPNDKPLSAPLILGRVDWQPTAKATATELPSYWLWTFIGGSVLIIGGNLAWWFWRRKTPPRLPRN